MVPISKFVTFSIHLKFRYKLSPREKKETIELISAHNNAYSGVKDKEGYMVCKDYIGL